MKVYGKGAVPVQGALDRGTTMEVVVSVREVVLVDGLTVLPIVPKSTSEHHRDRAGTTFPNPQSPSNSVVKPTFAAMLGPLDCCSCQFWHPRSNHQYHDSEHPDLHWQG